MKYSKQELIEIISKGSYPLGLTKFLEQFGDIEDIVEFSKSWSTLEGINVRLFLEDFISQSGFTSTLFNTYADGGSCISPARFSDIEYEVGKVKSCIEGGSLLVTSKTDPELSFLLAVQNKTYHDCFTVFITAKKRHTEPIEQFFRALQQHVVENNIFRKQKINGRFQFLRFDHVYSWSDLIVSPRTKSLINRNITNFLNNVKTYHSFGLTNKRGVILSGAPGTGKTLVGKILSHVMPEWTLIWLSPGDLQRADDVKMYYQAAKSAAPTILFLEDLDLHFQSRDNAHFNSMLGELMNQLDGIEDVSDIVVIGTTNRPGELEKALASRPGRFDTIIEFPNPEAAERLQMFQLWGKGRVDPNINWSKLVANTHSFSGAQIKEVVNQAFLRHLDEMGDNDSPILLTEQELLGAIKVSEKKEFTPTIGFKLPTAPEFLSDESPFN